MRERDGNRELFLTHCDRLGSVTAVTTAQGEIIERYAYNPWGLRVDPDDWSLLDERTSFWNNRGYTGHEHLDAFRLINMNGRMYDPLTCMFLSPDPQLQDPYRWLNYNRYAYCYGNPNMYTDPSGEFAWIPVVVGAVVGACIGTYSGYRAGARGWKLVAYAGVGLVSGAAAGCGAAAVSSALGGTVLAGSVWQGAIAGATGGAIGGFITGAGVSVIEGASFGSAMMCGVYQGAMGMALGAVLGGLTAGISNAYHGKNFWTGKVPESPATAAENLNVNPSNTNIDDYASACKMTDTYKNLPDPKTLNSNLPAKYEPNLPATNYPPNNGAVYGTEIVEEMQPGMTLDRFGNVGPSSCYMSPEGTPIPARSLMPGVDLDVYSKFTVVKPFPATKSLIAPWYGQPGYGVQYRTFEPIQKLIEGGYLIRW